MTQMRLMALLSDLRTNTGLKNHFIPFDMITRSKYFFYLRIFVAVLLNDKEVHISVKATALQQRYSISDY